MATAAHSKEYRNRKTLRTGLLQISVVLDFKILLEDQVRFKFFGEGDEKEISDRLSDPKNKQLIEAVSNQGGFEISVKGGVYWISGNHIELRRS